MTSTLLSTESRVVIISDTHGYVHPQIRQLINQSDLVIHAGDIGDAGVLDSLYPDSGQIIAVRGNNDLPYLWPASQANRLTDIPVVNRVTVPGGIISVEHGDRFGYSPDHQALRSDHQESRMIVYGHTHRLVVDDDMEPWVVNPGAAGNSRNHGGASCLCLHASESSWTIEPFKFADQA